MEKYLIINADDFGWDPYTIDAIFSLAKKGAISSTTVMTNLVDEQSFKNLIGLKNISVGLHLNLTSGRPLSNPSSVKTLINKEGNFYSTFDFYIRFCQKKINLSEMGIEINEQINFFKKFDILPTHIDSHQHIHFFPSISKVIADFLKNQGIDKIRTVNNSNSYLNFRKLILKGFYYSSKLNYSSFKTPEKLLSPFLIKKNLSIEYVLNDLKREFKKHDVLEWMVHPATKNRSDSYLNREKEFFFLSENNLITVLKKNNIKIISYKDL